MKIICGLGNPGRQYEMTHHNMGFLTVDEIAGRLGVQINKLKFKALLGETMLFGEKVILVKPQTFMNNSGESLREIMSFYKADPEDLFVIYDDIDLETGALRIRASGSSGSHNGMKSVIYQLQYDDFPRCRVGIGTRENIPLISYVTSQISEDEWEVLGPAISKAADAALVWVQYGIKAAMDFANVSDEAKKKAAAKKGLVIKTKHLIIRPISKRELEKYIKELKEMLVIEDEEEEETEGQKIHLDILKTAALITSLEDALEKMEKDPENALEHTPWDIRKKDGGSRAGIAFKTGDGFSIYILSPLDEVELEKEAKDALEAMN